MVASVVGSGFLSETIGLRRGTGVGVGLAASGIEAGGLLVAYTPSITQAVQVRESMGKGWVDQRTLEVLHRTWHIEGMAVRPDHRLVAHTAFLTVARWIG